MEKPSQEQINLAESSKEGCDPNRGFVNDD
jgi:hypothetical protein